LNPHQMSSDYEFSDDDGDYYDDEEMLDGTQEEG
jgi:ariadne-1